MKIDLRLRKVGVCLFNVREIKLNDESLVNCLISPARVPGRSCLASIKYNVILKFLIIDVKL